MLAAHSSFTPLRSRLDAIRNRWHRLVKMACEPYRPELHYMRGRGPKWHAKHLGHNDDGGL
jgi:hypothetical protein